MRVSLWFLVLGSLLQSACYDEVDKYFKTKGVNRLAVVRDDVRPGRLLIKKGDSISLVDDILDIVPDASLSMRRAAVVFPKADYNRELAPNVALGILDSIVPFNLSGHLKLVNAVHVDQITASSLRVSSVEINKILADPKSGPVLLDWLRAQSQNAWVGVVLEAFSASQLDISSSANKEITTDLGIGETKPIKEGKLSVTVKRTTSEKLTLSGDTSYVFAVKAYGFNLGNKKVTNVVVDLSAQVQPGKPVLGPPVANPGATTNWEPVELK